MNCPICEFDWPEGTPSCLRCCYDFANRDARLALSRIRRSNIAGNVMWAAGTGLVLLAIFLVLTISYSTILGLGLLSLGVTLATLGLIRADQTKKQLVRVKQRMQLPPARVV